LFGGEGFGTFLKLLKSKNNELYIGTKEEKKPRGQDKQSSSSINLSETQVILPGRKKKQRGELG